MVLRKRGDAYQCFLGGSGGVISDSTGVGWGGLMSVPIEGVGSDEWY